MLDTIFELYKDGAAIGIIAALTSMVAFLIIGTIRYVKRYAYAQPMCAEKEDATDCSFVLRFLWCAETFLEGKSIKDDEQIMKPIGAKIAGVGLDIAISGVILLVIGLLWPVVVPCIILWLPIQSMHNHHAKKKEFLEKLQGEKAEA